jgi:hypothetical protein
MVTDSTKRVLAIIVSFAGPSGLEQWNQKLGELFAAHSAGTAIETRIVA